MDSKNEITPTIMGIEEQEIKMIELIAEGLNNQEVSEVLNVKPAKVNTIRKNLIIKTKTKNAASLVSFAYKYGLLEV